MKGDSHMDAKLVEDMRNFMDSKSTEELVQIWRENDRMKYAEEAFEAIRQIFEERGETIPPQLPVRKTQPIRKKREIEGERGGFFSFRTLISPIVIKIIYVLGILGLTIGGIVMIMVGLDVMGLGAEQLNILGTEIFVNRQILIGIGIALIVFGNIGWRLFCESWILLFRIRDILGLVEGHLKRGSGKP
jgi:hypothetical protein